MSIVLVNCVVSLTLRVWEVAITDKTRKIIPTDCNLGQLKRVVNCIEMCDDGEHMYCGTTTGDILTVNIKTCLLKHFGPQKDKYSQIDLQRETNVSIEYRVFPHPVHRAFCRNDDKTAADYKIQGGSVLHLVLALRGGH